jgi:hypothetical protein
MQPFGKILDLSMALSRELDDVVFIGGVAVYLHSAAHSSQDVRPESSHDSDFMISFADYDVLKDQEEITSNARLAKHQMIIEGIEFDVYVERNNNLVVPYDEALAHSEMLENVRVACLEHLLVLKLEAFANREHSRKGEKDRRDVAKIGLLTGRHARRSLTDPYMHPQLLEVLHKVERGPVFHELCRGNSHEAKRMRVEFMRFVRTVA